MCSLFDRCSAARSDRCDIIYQWANSTCSVLLVWALAGRHVRKKQHNLLLGARKMMPAYRHYNDIRPVWRIYMKTFLLHSQTECICTFFVATNKLKVCWRKLEEMHIIFLYISFFLSFFFVQFVSCAYSLHTKNINMYVTCIYSIYFLLLFFFFLFYIQYTVTYFYFIYYFQKVNEFATLKGCA